VTQSASPYSVHTDRCRYTEWDGGKAGIAFYDHRADPDEFHNLAADPAQEKTLRQRRTLLRRVQTPGARVEIRGDPAPPPQGSQSLGAATCDKVRCLAGW
jgi:hypothetical protein